MDKVISVIGMVVAGLGVLYLLKPEFLKYIFLFFSKGKRLYLAGIIRLALAIVFFVSARECKEFWVIFSFGILFALSGTIIFAVEPDRLKKMLGWYQDQPLWLLRIVAIISIVFGAAIIYFA
jgi:uncharacterized protein YjeT (DUF2065 family)